MTFARRISPTNRIREQINLLEMVQKYGMSVPLEFKKPELNEDETMAIFASVFVFSGDRLADFVQEIVEFTYKETFEMLKRKMNYEEEN